MEFVKKGIKVIKNDMALESFTIVFLAVAFLSGIVDAISSVFIISNGGAELNPCLAWLTEFGLLIFFWLIIFLRIIAAIVILLITLLGSTYLINKPSKRIKFFNDKRRREMFVFFINILIWIGVLSLNALDILGYL